MRALPAAVLFGIAAAGGCATSFHTMRHEPLFVERRVTFDYNGIVVEPHLAGESLVYLDGVKAAVRLEPTAARRIPLFGQACFFEKGIPDWFLVDPTGMQAIVYGEGGGVTGDFIHVTGRHTLMACYVDFKNGTATPLFEGLPKLPRSFSRSRTVLGKGRLYHWNSDESVKVTDLSSGATSSLTQRSDNNYYCQVSERAASTATAACVYRNLDGTGSIEVWRHDVSTWPPRELEHFSIPATDLPHEFKGPMLSADGNHLYYGGYTAKPDPNEPLNAPHDHLAVAIDLRARAHAFLNRTSYHGVITKLAPTPTGDLLLVGEQLGSSPAEYHHRIRILDKTGTPLTEIPLPGTLKAILPLENDSGRRAWVVVDQTAHLLHLPLR